MFNKMITVINYKMGNLQSVINALDYLGISSEVTDSPSKILQAKKIILPGVGSFNRAMDNIRAMDLYSPIVDAVMQKKNSYSRDLSWHATNGKIK